MKKPTFNIKQKLSSLLQLIDFQEISEILGLNKLSNLPVIRSLTKLPGTNGLTNLTSKVNFHRVKPVLIAGAGMFVVVVVALSYILSSGNEQPDVAETTEVAETTKPADAHAIAPQLTTKETEKPSESVEIIDLEAPAATPAAESTQAKRALAETAAPKPAITPKPAPTTTKTVAVTNSVEELPFDIIEVEPPKPQAKTAASTSAPDELEIIEVPDENSPTSTPTQSLTPEEQTAIAAVKERNQRFYNRVEASLAENPEQESKARKYGKLLTKAGEFERGERFYIWYLKSHPKDVKAFYGLGQLYEKSKQWQKACRVYKRTADMDPQDVMARNSHAWILATTPDDTVRDGKAALALAQEANKLLNYPKPEIAETIGAAYAELGDFKAAIKIQKWAVRSAPLEARPAMMAKLKLYRSKQPYRSL